MFLSPDRFEVDVLGSPEPVLVDFFATGCPPCRMLAPVLDRIAADGVAVCKVEVGEYGALASRYDIGQVPTVVVIRAGEEVARFVGLQPEQALREAVERLRPQR